jgi:hypothetical protein
MHSLGRALKGGAAVWALTRQLQRSMSIARRAVVTRPLGAADGRPQDQGATSLAARRLNNQRIPRKLERRGSVCASRSAMDPALPQLLAKGATSA